MKLIKTSPGRISPAPAGAGRQRAFTLVEFIGVLAVILLLAAALAPAMIRRISQANMTREAANLATIADAFKQQVLRQKTIPNASGWVALVQTELNLAPQNISANPLGHARAFLIDPALSVGTNAAATLPFNQTSNGVANLPAGVRFLIVSSLYKTLPVSSGVPSSAAFSNIWHTTDGGVPAAWPAEWSGKGDQLKIQRIELNSAFRRLILNPLDPARYGRTTIDTGLPAAVTSIKSAWFLEGTLIGLYDTNNAGGTNFLEGREFLHSDRSYVFENGRWRAQIFDGKVPSASSGNPHADAFNESMSPFLAWPPQSGPESAGATPESVVSMFYSLMLSYHQWSLTGFNPGGHTKKMVQQDATDIIDTLATLIP